MPRNPTTGVYTRVSNTFSDPVLGDVIAPTDAIDFWDDLTDALNDIPQIVTSGPVYYFELLDDDGAVDQSATVATQLASCKTNGITHALFPPYFVWFEDITVDFPIWLEGSPVQIAKGNLDEGEQSQYGTRVITKAGSSHFNIPPGANGVTISGICFLQDQPASAPGFVPDVYLPCIQNNSAWTVITRNSFWAVYDGVQLGGPLFATAGSGYVTIRDNTFACFHRGIHVYKAGDWNLIIGNWFQNFFVEGPDTEWREYIQEFASAICVGRADALMIISNGVFGHLFGIETYINPDAPTPAEGIAERMKVIGNDFDKVHAGIFLDKRCTGVSIGNAIVGDNVAGSYAIKGNQNVQFEITGTDTINHGLSPIIAAETGCILKVVNSTLTNGNVDGGNPALSAVPGATIEREAVTIVGTYTADTGGGGTFRTGATLEASQTYTGAPNFSAGGTLAGTWSGNPTLAGGVFFGGAPRPSANDGAALGTTALQWSELYLAEGAVINWDNGDVTITQTGNVLSFAGATTRYEFDANLTPAASDGAALGTIALQFSDLFLATGGVINWNNGDARIISDGTEMDFLNCGVYYFDSHVRPFTNDAGQLGSGAVSWSDLFLASGAVINFNNGDITLTHGTDTLTFAGGTFINDVDRGTRFNNQTSAAAAQVGTLTNAPAAGNPGHWLKINIGGTNYAIPCWAG